MSITWTPEQKSAIDRIRGWAESNEQGLQLSLTGAAGCGKTAILAAIAPFLRDKSATFCAMTGKAALRVQEAVGAEAKTLHAVLYKRPSQSKSGRLYFSQVKPPKCKYLIIDEASMIGPGIYQDLQTWVMQGVRILYVGDSYQLPPVLSYKEIKEHGEDFSVFSMVEGPVLTKVMRSGDGVLDAITILREEGSVPKKSNGDYEIRRSDRPGMEAVEDFLADNDDHILITWRNKMRMQANRLIRQRLGLEGHMPIPGEPVFMCKNGQEVLNGEIHFCESLKEGPDFGKEVKCHWMHTHLGVEVLVNTQGRDEFMDGSMPDIKNWKEYFRHQKLSRLPEPIPVTYGYAGTAHKFQGSEARRATVFLAGFDVANPKFRKMTKLPNGQEMPFSNRWLYTSLSRAKSKVTLILGR